MRDVIDDTVRVRALRGTDVPALASLWVAAWWDAMPSIDFMARRGWIEDFLAGAGAAGRMTKVAERGGMAVGFVTVETAAAHLHQLAVAPSAKGGGAAVRLLAAAKADASRGLTLEVNQDNGRALRFYEREGFGRVAAGINPASGLATWHMRWRP